MSSSCVCSSIAGSDTAPNVQSMHAWSASMFALVQMHASFVHACGAPMQWLSVRACIMRIERAHVECGEDATGVIALIGTIVRELCV